MKAFEVLLTEDFKSLILRLAGCILFDICLQFRSDWRHVQYGHIIKSRAQMRGKQKLEVESCRWAGSVLRNIGIARCNLPKCTSKNRV